MKRLLLLAAALWSGLNCFSQDCLGYYFLQNNKTIEMAIYNKKGQEQARQIYKVANVNRSGGSTTADLATEMIDKKGKTIAKSTSQIKCEGGAILLDMKMSLPQQQATGMGETEVKTSEFYLEYPASMKTGDQLKDATMHMDVNSANGLRQSIDMEVKERKVEGQEKVTTAAGSWDCYRISFKSKVRTKTMGVGIPINIEGTEWFAPGFGIVKTESKHGSTEIVSIK